MVLVSAIPQHDDILLVLAASAPFRVLVCEASGDKLSKNKGERRLYYHRVVPTMMIRYAPNYQWYY